MIKINGQFLNVVGKSVEDYLLDSGYDTGRVAVEINEKIIPKSSYKDILFNDGDCVEIVSFVGGG